jgi:hypothetical protein
MIEQLITEISFLVKGGNLYFDVTSNGMTGQEWLEYFDSQGTKVTDSARSVLLSPSFKPTDGKTTPIVVFPGSVFEDGERTGSTVRKYAKKFGHREPDLEVSCLIRAGFTDKKLKELNMRSIFVMHKPVLDHEKNEVILRAGYDEVKNALCVYTGEPDIKFERKRGFAFRWVEDQGN